MSTLEAQVSKMVEKPLIESVGPALSQEEFDAFGQLLLRICDNLNQLTPRTRHALELKLVEFQVMFPSAFDTKVPKLIHLLREYGA